MLTNKAKHTDAESKYYNPENSKAVRSVTVRTILGALTAYVLLALMTGRYFDIYDIIAVIFNPIGALIFYAILAVVFYIPISSVKWNRSLLLNFCVSAMIPLILLLPFTSEELLLYSIIPIIAVANYIHYFVGEKLPADHKYGFFHTLLLEFLNGIVSIIGFIVGVQIFPIFIYFFDLI